MGVRVLSTVGVAALAIGGAVALAPAASADSWTMPNLIGMNLQGAQDAIQALTDDKVWLQRFDRSDRQGSDADQRPRVVVCSSTPPPGATLTETTTVDFGVVRKDVEACP